jgi:hypothetical protein
MASSMSSNVTADVADLVLSDQLADAYCARQVPAEGSHLPTRYPIVASDPDGRPCRSRSLPRGVQD